MNRQTFYCEVVEWVRQLLLLARLVLESDELEESRYCYDLTFA